VMAARKLGITEAPCIVARGWSEAQKRAYVLADNQLALNAGWDAELLKVEIAELAGLGFELPLIGFDEAALAELLAPPDAGGEGGGNSGAGSLAERFGVPPFSVLNAREGWWQARKAAWLDLGIQSELGRGEGDRACPGGSPMPGRGSRANYAPGRSLAPGGKSATSGGGAWAGKSRGGAGYDREGGIPAGLAFGEFGEWVDGDRATSGTLIFDPVLCELAYRWFAPPGGVVFDPFAGGSVRGIVAAKLGRAYLGIDLRPEQIAANEAQAAAICAGGIAPRWVCGDSAAVVPGLDVAADFVFSCPPYGDLEVYSDDPADLSAMTHAAFIEAYRVIIAAAVAKLKPDRFACFVVGDFRDGAGLYRNFVSDTIDAFLAAGLALYNEAILVTACGSLPIRVGKQFSATRKLGKTHQNVLVFCKGDPRAATAAVGEVEFGEIEAPAEAGDAAFGEAL
ncbi:MAG: DNA modification methylase, partial [Novosphingobium sp.]|nr:DNA modification methylase [Novosphingobium sp.]